MGEFTPPPLRDYELKQCGAHTHASIFLSNFISRIGIRCRHLPQYKLVSAITTSGADYRDGETLPCALRPSTPTHSCSPACQASSQPHSASNLTSTLMRPDCCSNEQMFGTYGLHKLTPLCRNNCINDEHGEYRVCHPKQTPITHDSLHTTQGI